MSTIEEFLFARLTNVTAITSVVGSRIYPIKMPDNVTLPAISYQLVAGEQIESTEGSSGLAAFVFQIDCWARGVAQVKALGEAVRLALQGFRGTQAGVVVNGVTEWSSFEDYDSDTQSYRLSSSCRLWHTVNQPT